MYRFAPKSGCPWLQCVFRALIETMVISLRSKFSLAVTGSRWSGLTHARLLHPLAFT